MNEKDMAILCQGIALGFALTIVLDKPPRAQAWGIIALLLCSLVLTIWRLR